jgi:general secretion pathway protein F
MPEYIIKVASKDQVKKRVFTADSEVTARRKAKRDGRILSVKKKSAIGALFEIRMRPEERVLFLQRLAMMMESRVAMTTALQVMRGAFTGGVKRVSDQLYSMVEQGMDFAEAIGHMRKDIPETTSALITSGIQGGNLAQALQNAADFELEMAEIKRGSSKGLFGAIFTFLASLGMILGTSMFVGPAVMESDLITQAGDSVDVDWVFQIANIISVAMVGIVAFVVALIGLRFVIKPVASAFADRVILKIPVYRDLVLSKNNYTVFHGLAMLIDAGVRMEQALFLSGKTAPKGEVKEDLWRAHRAVRSGQPWAQAMKSLHPTDIAALSTSQDRVQIARAIHAVAAQSRKIYSQRISEVVPGLQLLSALFMTIAGGLIFGMVIIPMLQMTQGLM